MSLAIGAVLENRYRIEALLGEGGMGAVYRARHLRIQQDVAIKENRTASPASARQFEREAVVMAGLRHPNLPRVSDHFVLPDGAQYLVMDYIEGHDLCQILAQSGPLDEARAVAWIERVCDALAYLHSQQPPVIHRDVKPSNIKITPRGEVYLVDFGIAKVGDARAATTQGAMGVTPGFSPLEQYGSGGTDARSDIYALGATLYALLTGNDPPDSVEIASGGATLTPPAELARGLSPRVAAALRAAMRTRPTDRPQTVDAFRNMLREAVVAAPGPITPVVPRADVIQGLLSPPATPRAKRSDGTGPRARAIPRWAFWAGGAALVVLAIGIWGLWPREAANTTPTPAPTQAPRPTDAPTEALAASGPALGDILTRPADGMVMVYVPAGEFEMGSKDGGSDEQPVHTVSLDGFWIDETEVTNAQYAAFLNDEGNQTEGGVTWLDLNDDDCLIGRSAGEFAAKSGVADHPVIEVSWYGARAYCAWAEARLPTEAEWEYAARGPESFTYPWGNAAPTCDRANYGGQDGCVRGMTAVGSYPGGTSWCGALDMAGNVWEWAQDWYGEDYYGTSRDRDPQGPSSGQYRILRGGSWLNGPSNVRSAGRYGDDPDYTYGPLGFRCARGS